MIHAHTHRRSISLFLGAAALTVASFAPSAAASPSKASSASCAAQVLSAPFASYGDTNAYWLAPGGDFENGTSAWSLMGAKVVAGNETLGILPGTRSLQFGGAGALGASTATTPSFCVDPDDPTFRFLVENASTLTAMTTWINFTAKSGATLTVPAKLSAYALGSWSLAESQPLATTIPPAFLKKGTTATITFRVSQTLAAEGLRIDDLMIDPYRRG